MCNIVPLSAINKQGFTLLYFDIQYIETPEKIDKAYILVDSDSGESRKLADAFLNDALSSQDSESLHASLGRAKINDQSSEIAADVSEIVKMLATEYVLNNGMAVHKTYLKNPRLMVTYKRDIICPRCNCNGFFENEIIISGYNQRAETPWYKSAWSHTITFYVENLGKRDVTVYLQNSPNGKNAVGDPQRLTLAPGQTADIIPYKFSKFTRLVADSTRRNVALRVWFQTQLANC